MFTEFFVTVPGGAVTAHRFTLDARIASEEDLHRAGVYARNPHQLISPHRYDHFSRSYRDDDGNTQPPPEPRAYFQFIADEARRLGYDAISRVRDGRLEVISLNTDKLESIPVDVE